MLDKRKRVAKASLSGDVADTERFIDLFLLLFGPLLVPPAPNHLLTRIVRENSFCDVLPFLGPVSFFSSDMKRHPPDLVCRIVDGDGDIIVVDVDGVKNASTLFDPAHMAASSKQQIDRRILISVYYCLFFDVSLSPRYLRYCHQMPW
mmetsp:Transcript_1629/g.2429  ORF Transcript_1629/g.2429 Transcript_1629/m.2429 type:complete len:148 (+) Transcript_1629:590-1033(+)